MKENGNAICYTPDQFHTDELYEIAIRSHPQSLLLLPFQKQTHKFRLLALSVSGDLLRPILYNFNLFQSYNLDPITYMQLIQEMCCTAIQQNGMVLIHVPKQYRTKDLLIAAIHQTPLAFAFFLESDDMTINVCFAVLTSGKTMEELKIINDKVVVIIRQKTVVVLQRLVACCSSQLSLLPLCLIAQQYLFS